MGCVSSKIATRSRSFRDELSGSLQRRINGLPVFEDLLVSKNGGDQFLALVCTANTVAKKLQSGTLPSQTNTDVDQPVELTNSETIDTWELMAGLEEQQQQQQHRQQQSPPPHGEEGHNEVAIASKDFHEPKEYTSASGGECSVSSNNFDVVTKNASIGDIGGLIRSRSFHTVEEYDALVRASHRQSEAGVNVTFGVHSERYSFNVVKTNGSIRDDTGLHIRSRSFHILEEYDSNRWSEILGETRIGDPRIKMDVQLPEASGSPSRESCLQFKHICMAKEDDQSTIIDRDKSEEAEAQNASKNLEFKKLELKNMECTSSSCATDAVSINEDIAKKGMFKVEKGFRRKSKGKELTTLSIPTTAVDFPAIGSLGEWFQPGGQVFSSGEYVTPKFGNFNIPISINGNTGPAVFDPEMVAAFEEAMKQLTIEEECILKQIEEDTDEEGKDSAGS